MEAVHEDLELVLELVVLLAFAALEDKVLPIEDVELLVDAVVELGAAQTD